MERLEKTLTIQEPGVSKLFWNGLDQQWPSHQEKPYAFKAYALKTVDYSLAFDTLLWADSCILPVADMEPLWQKIETDGYWIARNGWNNYQWTADSAYPDLFFDWDEPYARQLNREIPHVVATSFGISLKHAIGREFLAEYYRLASDTNAFCGPWTNTPNTPCGPPDVIGHRHDQTAASVIAWRLGMRLTDCPEIFAYGKQGDQHDPRTILIADGSYD
jgi:hypothetical protein